MSQAQRNKWSIHWSPHDPSKFCVVSADFRLYEINDRSKGRVLVPSAADETGDFPTAPPLDPAENRKTISLLSVNTELQAIKGVAWSLDKTDPLLLAVATHSGKILLSSFSTTSRIIKEFVPRTARPCHAIAWNPINHNQFAAGYDKLNKENCVMIWDVHQKSDDVQSLRVKQAAKFSGAGDFIGQHDFGRGTVDLSFSIAADSSAETVWKPSVEFCMADSIVSLAWAPNSASLLVAGSAFKNLKLFDIRGSEVAQSVVVAAHSKSVQGIHFDPFHETRLATYSDDNIIKIWDLRKLSDPVLSIQTNSKNPVAKIAWCPTREGVLASISREEKTVKLWYLQDMESKQPATAKARNPADDIELSICKPPKTHVCGDVVVSFSWHPTDDHRMLTLSKGSTVEDSNLHDNIPLSWSPSGDLTFSFGRQIYACSASEPQRATDDPSRTAQVKDISLEMKERALQGYGFDCYGNAKIVESHPDTGLHAAWKWMCNAKENAKSQPTSRYSGLYSLLFEKPAPEQIDPVIEPTWKIPIYRSASRKAGLLSCEWFDEYNKQDLERAISRLESLGRFEEAAALAIFHLDVRRAIATLTNSNTDPSLKIVAMSLAGIDRQNPIWRDTCIQLRTQPAHPYIRAIFAFLSSDAKDYPAVLSESGLKFSDRIAFAMRFLSDVELQKFMDRTMNFHVKHGKLEGLILTGLGSQGLELITNYVNLTSDVQTAALLTIHAFAPGKQSRRVHRWWETYRDLMDRWQLWHERAILDITRLSIQDQKPGPQVFARCNFCHQALYLASMMPGQTMMGRGPGRGVSIGGASSQKPKASSCPNCRRPLPRCAVCLLPLNTKSPKPGADTKKDDSTAASANLRNTKGNIDDWFTWCQTCRHGGHAKHMMDWFSSHRVCPVYDCNCPCMSLDNYPKAPQ
eukprot:TRINITY_DN7336_c0_g1_i1.p1 TRINITY_DN7336_c0_g1~~TRINITY_DN7336_c0_g1_i1.p1  ORF type:complete len:915 (+),score=151.64 TRINITY_DN7336_c0_g1_i1:62-2806(+)